MKSIKIDVSKYNQVDSLWSQLIEDYGFEKAKNIVSQAIDLQKMNGKENITLPIILSGTGGLALIPIGLLKKQDIMRSFKNTQFLIFNLKKKSFQIIKEAT